MAKMRNRKKDLKALKPSRQATPMGRKGKKKSLTVIKMTERILEN